MTRFVEDDILHFPNSRIYLPLEVQELIVDFVALALIQDGTDSCTRQAVDSFLAYRHSGGDKALFQIAYGVARICGFFTSLRQCEIASNRMSILASEEDGSCNIASLSLGPSKHQFASFCEQLVREVGYKEGVWDEDVRWQRLAGHVQLSQQLSEISVLHSREYRRRTALQLWRVLWFPRQMARDCSLEWEGLKDSWRIRKPAPWYSKNTDAALKEGVSTGWGLSVEAIEFRPLP